MGEAVIAAGIGCRRGAGADDVSGAVEAALAAYGRDISLVGRFATSARKSAETGIIAAASKLGLDVIAVADEVLQAMAARTLTRSKHSLGATALPSLSEAAALAAAGKEARLLGPRVAFGGATCALAEFTP
ncbi:MAG: cobalamin biosynthesis protein [Rhizobiaceae bacterium]